MHGQYLALFPGLSAQLSIAYSTEKASLGPRPKPTPTWITTASNTHAGLKFISTW